MENAEKARITTLILLKKSANMPTPPSNMIPYHTSI